MTVLLPSCPVLLADGDEEFRKPLIAALDREHFTVTIAGTGVDALRELQTRAFEVVILDINFPDIRRDDILKYIRDNRTTVKARVIIVTAGNPRLREEVDVSIAEEVLLKPVDSNHVARRARRYCTG